MSDLKDGKGTGRRQMLVSSAVGGAAILFSAQGVLAIEQDGQGGVEMARLGEVIIPPEKEGREKHAPHIEAPAGVKSGQPFEVSVIVGKEVHHPNTVGHHIKSVSVYAKEDGARPVVQVAAFDFGPSYAEPKVTFTMKLGKSSRIFALAYCNLHGLWDSSVKVEVK